MTIRALFLIAKKRKPPTHLSADELINIGLANKFI